MELLPSPRRRSARSRSPPRRQGRRRRAGSSPESTPPSGQSFLGQIVIARGFSVDVPASGAWERLPVEPVQVVSLIESVGADGAATVLPSDGYAVDVDAGGAGWVRATSAAGTRLRVSGTAGLAASQNETPEPIRQGVLRLVAHLFATRDGDGGAPPAAVTALWRPYRKARLA